MKGYFYYLFIVTMISIIFYGLDKVLAIIKKNRVSENWLFLLSMIGGPLGCFIGMFLFRHKIRKIKFYIINFVMAM